MTTRRTYPNGGAEPIAAYLTALSDPLRDVAAAARAAIDNALPQAHAAIWHGHPVWSRSPDPGRKPICLLKAYTSHVTFGLWQGQAVDDPTGRLEPGSRQMASTRLRSVEDVDPQAIASWLKQARRLSE